MMLCPSNPIVPLRGGGIGQGGQPPQIQAGFARAMEVGTARSEKAITSRHVGVFPILVWPMATCHHFDAFSAQLAELLEQGIELHWRIVVATRVRNDGTPARLPDPADCLLLLPPLQGPISRTDLPPRGR